MVCDIPMNFGWKIGIQLEEGCWERFIKTCIIREVLEIADEKYIGLDLRFGERHCFRIDVKVRALGEECCYVVIFHLVALFEKFLYDI